MRIGDERVRQAGQVTPRLRRTRGEVTSGISTVARGATGHYLYTAQVTSMFEYS